MEKLESVGERCRSLRHKIFDSIPLIYVEVVPAQKAKFRKHVRRIEYINESECRVTRISWPWFRLALSNRMMHDYLSMSIPLRFGFSYQDFDRDVRYMHLIPFNFIVALARAIYWRIRWDWTRNLGNYEHHVTHKIRQGLRREMGLD